MTDRRLAAVMVTDMVGFTTLMAADPERALRTLNHCHALLRPIVSNCGGLWVGASNDRSLAIFSSALMAIQCSLKIKQTLAEQALVELRIGVDLGDVLIVDGQAYGDAVNVASLIERLADPGGLVISEPVYEAVRGELDLGVVDLGEKVLKNIDHSVRLYALSGHKQPSPTKAFFSSLILRRVPHIIGAYLAATWAVVEVVDWLVDKNLLESQWPYALGTGLLVLLPSVFLIAYTHGAHGRDRTTHTERVAVPLNLIAALTLATMVHKSVGTSVPMIPISAASVAVLPFVNLSQSGKGDHFSLGLSEELINALANIPGLYVPSRTSSFLFDGANRDPRKIASSLRVATVLEGSVRTQGDRVRVTAQLIDGANNYHLWSETYDRNLADIFQVQSDIAAAVATQLIGVLKPGLIENIANNRAASPATFDFYSQGLSYLRQPTTAQSLSNARNLFQRALQEEADYAPAFAALCETALAQYILDKDPGLIDIAEAECTKALALAPQSRDVRYALGELYRSTGQLDTSARVLGKLVDSASTTRAWVSLGKTRDEQGELVAAEDAFRTAINLEPGNWLNHMALGEFLYWKGQFREALAVFGRVLELTPDNARAYLYFGASHGYLGNRPAALQATEKSIELSPTRGAYRDLGMLYFHSGDLGRAADALRKAIEMGPHDHTSWGTLGQVYHFNGNHDDAHQAFGEAAELARAAVDKNPADWVGWTALALYQAMLGQRKLALEQLDVALSGGAHSYVVQYGSALVHTFLGNQQQALDAIELAFELGAPVQMIAREPYFLELKSTQRFQELISPKEGKHK